MTRISAGLINNSGVRTDWVDLRDQNYVPNLLVLRENVSINPTLVPIDTETGKNRLIFGVRNQGATGRCVGFALANLIDIQRNLQWLKRVDGAKDAIPNDTIKSRENIVSADMLYRMAFFHDRYPDLEDAGKPVAEGVRTLRSAIKGFYHHGVCLDWPETTGAQDASRWQSTSFNENSVDRTRLFPTVEQAKNARGIGLGAYYRLASVLNHFHAALNDAEAVLTTANVHDGWLRATPENDGLIGWPPEHGKTGTHAFVLTGYDENGFHVLNSWGEDWGGYRNQAGIALWSYADWAQNVIDSWVLRLGVFAPSAFGASIGEKGTKGLAGAIRTGSTPCSELVGHYSHLDDGFHVSTGSYPSFKDGWERTRDYLTSHLDRAAKPKKDTGAYRGVLVWIPGSLEGIKPAFAASVQRKNRIKELGLYPYSVFWCNSFVEKSLEVLDSLFDSCKAQAGEDAAHLDDLIESRVRGVGRAFWRDIELSARRALRGTFELPYEVDEADIQARIETGYVGAFLADLMKLKSETGCEVHLVAEGAGALIVHEMLSLIRDDPQFKDAKECFDTLHLVHPAIGMPRANKLLIPLIEKMNGPITGKKKRKSRSSQPHVQPLLESKIEPRARIYIPTPELEDRIYFGSYRKSILHLVSRAFEDRYSSPSDSEEEDMSLMRKPRQFLGMAGIAEDDEFAARGAVYLLNRIAAQHHDLERVSQTELTDDPTITNAIFETIKAFNDAKNLK